VLVYVLIKICVFVKAFTWITAFIQVRYNVGLFVT
jgi:hypothetical protein